MEISGPLQPIPMGSLLLISTQEIVLDQSDGGSEHGSHGVITWIDGNFPKLELLR